jgi:hypothetical protein
VSDSYGENKRQQNLYWFGPPKSNTLRPLSSCRGPVLGLFVVGVTNWSGEGVGPKSLRIGVRFVDSPTLVMVALLSLLLMQGEGYKGKENTSYSIWSLGSPIARRCPSGHIEVELCRLVVEAGAWPGGVVCTSTLGAPSE